MYCCCCSVLRSCFDSDDDNATPHRDNNAPDWTGRKYSIIADASRRYNKNTFGGLLFYIKLFKIGGDTVCDAYLRETGRCNNNNNSNNNTCSGDISVWVPCI